MMPVRSLVDLIRRSVKLRFGLAAEAFADHLIERGRSAGVLPGDLIAHAGRLSLDDLYLATACARGEEAAWEECARRHFAFIRDFARRYLPEVEASDLGDEVIAGLWQRGKIARFDGRSTLRTWLGAVTAHAALNALKASRRRVPLESGEVEASRERGEPIPAPCPTDEDARGILRHLVGEAIGRLPSEDKLLLLLRYEQGLTLDEMTAVLGGSKSTMNRRLTRTCTDLREALEAQARDRFGETTDVLRAGVELGDLDLDLAALVRSRPAGTDPA
jgi:RNA polymerase sigma factor (sigma-70 family)